MFKTELYASGKRIIVCGPLSIVHVASWHRQPATCCVTCNDGLVNTVALTCGIRSQVQGLIII